MAKAKAKPMFWITGNYYECQNIWKSICERAGDPNVEILDCGYAVSNASMGSKPATASDVIMLLKNADIFDDRPRIIKMKGLPEKYSLITDYLHLVNDKNILVIDGPIGLRDKRSMKRLVSVAASKFYKTFKKEGQVFQFETEPRKDSDAVAWLISVAEDYKKNFEKDAAQLLVRYRGRNYDILYSELLKLCDYQSGRKITKEDVNACCISEFLATTWELLDSLDRLDYDSAICHMQKFHENAGSDVGATYRSDAEMLLGAMFKHYFLLVAAKDACGGKVTYQGVKQAIEGLKRKYKDKWDKDWFEENYLRANINKITFNHAMQWSKKKVYQVYRDVSECRFLCRTRGALVSDLKLYLDGLVMSICGKLPCEYNDLTHGHINRR